MEENEFNPNWTSIPGDTIRDIVKEKHISYRVLRRELNLSHKEFRGLLWNGKTRITLGIARKLNELLGGSIEFWMMRDFNYWKKFNELKNIE